MKTLYLSDLDGTLLSGSQTVSDFTARTINELVSRGMVFSYATARGFGTATKATSGITAKIPLIVYNGAFIMDNATGERLYGSFFGEDIDEVIISLIRGGVYPIVYSIQQNRERFSYVPKKCSRAAMEFIETRRDSRNNPVENECGLFAGQRFYLSCIDDEEKLRPFWEQYKERYNCVYARDIYSGEQWLEIMPKASSKAAAARRLMDMLSCERLVVFGDGLNDIDLFRMADEGYAVENAETQLKSIATAIIGSNDSDSVAKKLLDIYTQKGE